MVSNMATVFDSVDQEWIIIIDMRVQTRDDLLGTLSEAKASLSKRFRIAELALFGSWARGEQTADSDVDLLVEVDASLGLEFVTLAETLEQRLGLPVDLVSKRAVNPRHWDYIKNELIYV